jgi:polysaccharide biosynthesis protein PslH
MSPLRVVVAMIEAPLPFGNAAARWFYVLLRGLKERGHSVTAFAACSNPREIDKAKSLFPAPDYDLRLYPFPERKGLKAKWETFNQPYSYMFSDEFRRDLDAELAKGFDILHLEQLWAGWLGLNHVDKSLVNVHHLTWIDLGQQRSATLKDRWLERVMFATERRLIGGLRHFRSCSPRLVEPMREVNPSAQIDVVPVGIDATLYDYIPDDRRGTEPIVSVIGSMAWYPGYSAAVRLLTRLWPEIKRRVPSAKLQVVGWSARSALKDHLDTPDVEIHENVPEIQPYFDRTSVLVYAPSRGSGMKIKILESMAFGVPLVTTSEGVEGIPAIDGEHAGVCEDDAGLIDRAVALLEDPARQNRQRRAARELLERHCGPEPTLDGIEAIYSRMMMQETHR